MNKKRCAGIAVMLVLVFTMVFLPFALAGTTLGQIGIASSSVTNEFGNGWSLSPDVSGDGRYVVFASFADNLVEGDNNSTMDVFRKDTETGEIVLVSHSLGGAGPAMSSASGLSNSPSISADGRFVVFTSSAEDLVVGDTNGKYDAFLWDATTELITRISESSSGEEGDGWTITAEISGDGKWVAFISDSTNLLSGVENDRKNVFYVCLETGVVSRIESSLGAPNGSSYEVDINYDGSRIVFTSGASNLVPGETPSNYEDVYLFDRLSGDISYVVRNTEGGPADSSAGLPSISPNGRYVAFFSFAENLHTIDYNGYADVFLLDTHAVTYTLELVSIDFRGFGANNNSGMFLSSVNDAGQVAFVSRAYDLVSGLSGFLNRIFVYTSDGTYLVADGFDADSHSPVFAGENDLVFASLSDSFVSGDENNSWDVFKLSLEYPPTATVIPTASPTPTITPTPTATPPPPEWKIFIPFAAKG